MARWYRADKRNLALRPFRGRGGAKGVDLVPISLIRAFGQPAATKDGIMCSDDGRAANEGSVVRDEASLPSLSTRAQPLISTSDGLASIIEAIPADDESPKSIDEICL